MYPATPTYVKANFAAQRVVMYIVALAPKVTEFPTDIEGLPADFKKTMSTRWELWTCVQRTNPMNNQEGEAKSFQVRHPFLSFYTLFSSKHEDRMAARGTDNFYRHGCLYFP